MPVLPRRWFVPAPPPESLLEKPSPVSSTVAYALAHPDPSMATRPRILVTAFGSESPRITETINAACSIALMDGLFPIVAASELSIEFLVNAPMPIETLPRRAHLRCLSELEYSQYVNRRWTIILGKWAVSETIDLAKDFAGFVEDQLDT